MDDPHEGPGAAWADAALTKRVVDSVDECERADGVAAVPASPTEKPPTRSTWRIFMLAGTIFALEVGLSLETAFVVPLFAQLGVSERFSSLLFCMGPIAGVFLQPLMGNASDRSNARWGRRRPFILALSVGMMLGLLIIPNGEWLGSQFGDSGGSHARAIALCTIGVLLLDFCCDSIQGPCRAYLLDVVPVEQQETGNSVFGIIAGIGSCVGYIAGGIDWGPVGRLLGTQLRTVYTCGLVLVVACTACTLFSIPETPRAASTNREGTLAVPFASGRRRTVSSGSLGGHSSASVNAGDDESTPLISQAATPSQPRSEDSFSLREILSALLHPPKPIVRICIVHFFGWISLLSYVIFFTDYMGLLIYGGDPDAAEGTHDRTAYEDGVRVGSLGLAVFAFGSFVGSVGISRAVPRFGLRIPYMACYACTFVGAGAIALTRSLYVALPLCAIAGGVFCAICTMPFMCLVAYDAARGSDGQDNGLNVAVVNTMMFVAQLLVSFTMGNVIRAVGTVAFAMYTSSVAAGVGAVATFFLVLGDDLRDYVVSSKRRVEKEDYLH